MSALAASLLLAAATPSPGVAAPAALGLGVMPARLELVGRAPAVLSLRNPGSRPLRVAVAASGVAYSARGRPRTAAASGAATWLRIRPRLLGIAAGGTARLEVRAAPPRRAAPGDHAAVVLLSALPTRGSRIRIRLRVGVVVLVRVPGAVVHRLRPLALTVRGRGRDRVLEVRLANRGNVCESLGPEDASLALVRGRRVVARPRVVGRELLPGDAGLLDFVYRGRLHGRVRVRLELPGARRVFRIRLPPG